MPEGDTIHQIALSLAPDLVGQSLDGGRIRRLPEIDLAGRGVTNVHALGKHLFIEFDDGCVLRSHLGMYGSWHRYTPGGRWRRPARQASIVMETGARLLVCFNAAQVKWLRAHAVCATTHRLGPDLLGQRPDWRSLAARARRLLAGDTPLVDVLLDQRVACGIGNVYKSELLFMRGLAPMQGLADTADEALTDLYALARRLLAANLGPGPRRTRDARGGGLWVYKRSGRPCLRCATPIMLRPLGRHQRPTYWCPGCQGEL